jgi:hypothetical protein
VADWLTKLVTGVATPLKVIFVTRSRFVPAMVRSVACNTGLGVKDVIAGKITLTRLSVSNWEPLVPP